MLVQDGSNELMQSTDRGIDDLPERAVTQVNQVTLAQEYRCPDLMQFSGVEVCADIVTRQVSRTTVFENMLECDSR